MNRHPQQCEPPLLGGAVNFGDGKSGSGTRQTGTAF